MTQDNSRKNMNTRNLVPPPAPEVPKPRGTGPLDDRLPWVIEFRIVGTASTMQVHVKDEMLIGRADTDGLTTPDIDLADFGAFTHGVSRRHAMIRVRDQRLYLQDLGSTNGTMLNGVLCDPDQEHRLRHGDELMLGQLRLQMLFAVVPVMESKTRTSEMPPVPLEAAIRGIGQQVLVLEDDPDVGNVFRIALEQAGYQVTVVESVTKALAVVLQTLPDVIIMDLMLPDMNGLDLVSYVRKQHPKRHIPIIVVSGATGGFQKHKALDAGADVFLGKPVAVDELIKAVSTAIAV